VSLAALLAATVAQLERAAVPYMITGSVASSYHGEPRATRDLDIVIDPDRGGIGRLVGELEAAGLYVDKDAALSAFDDRTQWPHRPFRMVHPERVTPPYACLPDHDPTPRAPRGR
jgi:hypothetical protein